MKEPGEFPFEIPLECMLVAILIAMNYYFSKAKIACKRVIRDCYVDPGLIESTRTGDVILFSAIKMDLDSFDSRPIGLLTGSNIMIKGGFWDHAGIIWIDPLSKVKYVVESIGNQSYRGGGTWWYGNPKVLRDSYYNSKRTGVRLVEWKSYISEYKGNLAVCKIERPLDEDQLAAFDNCLIQYKSVPFVRPFVRSLIRTKLNGSDWETPKSTSTIQTGISCPGLVASILINIGVFNSHDEHPNALQAWQFLPNSFAMQKELENGVYKNARRQRLSKPILIKTYEHEQLLMVEP